LCYTDHNRKQISPADHADHAAVPAVSQFCALRAAKLTCARHFEDASVGKVTWEGPYPIPEGAILYWQNF